MASLLIRRLLSGASASTSSRLDALRTAPSLGEFIRQQASPSPPHGPQDSDPPAVPQTDGAATPPAPKQNVYLETYGCQMNVNDTEVVLSILAAANYQQTDTPEAADVILVNTCAIRENAEGRVWGRLGHFKGIRQRRRQQEGRAGPVVGVLGCMAERLKAKLLEADRLADVVAGPDAYRDLPRLLSAVQGGAAGREGAMNVQLSLEETYADIAPTRRAGQKSAFVSIMRGCNNMCAFCIVPFTRGRERSRPVASIVEEVRRLVQEGVREVTLLGQNVNSYADFSPRLAAATAADATDASTFTEPAAAVPHVHAAAGAAASPPDWLLRPPLQGGEVASTSGSMAAAAVGRLATARAHTTAAMAAAVYAPGFSSVYQPKREGAVQFAELLDAVARVHPELRVRFTSPHPKDFTEDVLQVIATHPNVCKQLHMPAQSGSSEALARMKRGYTREAYDALVRRVREVLPGAALSTDIIVGFCGETEEEHQQTLSLLQDTSYDNAFIFAYSDRGKTYASRHYADDVPQEVKSRRLQEALAEFRRQQEALSRREIGRIHLVLVEGPSKKSQLQLQGRTCTMKRAVFATAPLAPSLAHAVAALRPVLAEDGAASDASSSVGNSSVGSSEDSSEGRQIGECATSAASAESNALREDAGAPGEGAPGEGAGVPRLHAGEYVAVRVDSFSHGTLLATPLARTSIAEFSRLFGSTIPQQRFERW